MEGVVLYVLLVKVFVEGSQKKYIIWFTLISYGELFFQANHNRWGNYAITQVCQLSTCLLLFPWVSC